MAEPQYDKLNLVGLHTPDFSTEIDAGGNKYQQELPGTYEVGFRVGDTFLAIATFKAGNIADALETMKVTTGSGSSASKTK